MPHPVMITLPMPLSDAQPWDIQRALADVRQEMELAVRGIYGEPLETRIDRLEAFALLSEQHTANVIEMTK